MRNKKTTIVILIGVGFFLLFGLIRQLSDSFSADKRLISEQARVKELKQKNQILQKKIQEVESVGFLEEQARNKLNLTRGNETVVIIPQSEIDRILNTEKKMEEVIKIPNWQGWLRLFLH